MAKPKEFPEALWTIEEARHNRTKHLNLSDAGLTELPESVKSLTQLHTLDLSRNKLKALPEWLGQLTQLRTLELGNNPLTLLPTSIGDLVNLEKLGLLFQFGEGRLITLPDSIGNLRKLVHLDLEASGIQNLPDSIGELSNLEALELPFNRLTTLPATISQLSKLRMLRLEGNPLEAELEAADEQGLDAVKAYLRAKSVGTIILNEAKLILIGEGEVGKSSLLAALRGDGWVEKRATTHGVEVDIKTVVLTDPESGKRITFNGWDFGGQNIYRHTHQLFFTAPAVYLAVWNPRRGTEQCCVDEWMRMVRQRAFDETRPDERPRILVVATHGGPKERSAHIDEQLLRDEFGFLIAGFHHVESRPDPDTGVCHGLEELKQAIAREAAAIPSVGRTVPRSWKNLLDALQTLSDKDPYITYEQFRSVCSRKRVSKELADTYAAILNELGYLIHYQGDEILQDTVILKPEYISKAISYALEDSQIKADNGLVEHDRLCEIWNDPAHPDRDRYPPELHRIFLRLMERFDLSYQVVMPKEDDPPTSLVAQLVPGGRPDNWEQDWPSQPEMGDSERRRICRLVDVETGRPAEVEGLLYRLIVRLHRYSLGRNSYFDSRHWKTGMILDDDFNGRAFIEEIASDVHVTVRAAYPDGFLGSLCNEIRSLVDQFWRGLDCRLSVPCHTPCKGLHEVELLVETRRRGIVEVLCPVCRNFQQIDSLLVAATPKLPMDVVIGELAKIQSKLSHIEGGVATLDTDVRQMIGQANEQFDLMMNAMASLAKDGPRLFSFEPVDPGFLDKPTWIAEKFRLTLWCEHSKLPLPLLTGMESRGVYEVEVSREWVKKSAPVLKVLANTLSLVLPIAMPAAKLSIEAPAYKSIEDQLSFGKSCADGFLKGGKEVGEWLATGDGTEMKESRAQLAEGAALRELHALLRTKDKTSSFGGLVRVQNKRREFLWVHEQFINKY